MVFTIEIDWKFIGGKVRGYIILLYISGGFVIQGKYIMVWKLLFMRIESCRGSSMN